MNEKFTFLIVGVAGFLTDIALTSGLFYAAGFNPFLSRFIAICVAICLTFCLHYSLTFRDHSVSMAKAFIKYVTSNILSQGINYVMYAALLMGFTIFQTFPFTAVAISSITVMIISFCLFKYWVFSAS